MDLVKDWTLLDPVVQAKRGLHSKWLNVVLVPVDRPVDSATFLNVEPLYKYMNCVRCAFCKAEVRLNVPLSLVGTDGASAANVSFDNVKIHFETAHPKHPFVSSTR